MRDLLSSVLAETGSLSETTIQNSRDIGEEVASEGIILTKNDRTLPLTGVTNLNVFGWASTNPVYGGTGSGTVDASTAVTLLSGLENAGFSGQRRGGAVLHAPYTNGGIEKAAVNLATFGKTGVLQPGASETVTLTFDTHGTGYYVLESGEYEVFLRTDAHSVVNSFTFNVASDIVYNENNLHNNDLVVADSKLAFAEGTIKYLSRADGFANYASATAAPSNYTLDRDTYEISGNGTYDPTQHNNSADQMPTTGKNNGLELMDLRGKDYGDPMWEDLLDEVTVDEMVQLIAYGGFATVEVPSIKKVATLDSDGPAGVNYSVSGLFGMGCCGEILLAQTCNIDLAYKMGDGICQEFEDFGLDGWYAPSMNLHCSLFAGRNFEYYPITGDTHAQHHVTRKSGYAFGDDQIDLPRFAVSNHLLKLISVCQRCSGNALVRIDFSKIQLG